MADKTDTASWALVVVSIALAAAAGLVAWGSLSSTQSAQAADITTLRGQVERLTTGISEIKVGISDMQGNLREIHRCQLDRSTCENLKQP